MPVTTAKNTMLYCPHCQQTYENGTQRFCTNDGLRLLPAPSASQVKSANQTSGVFTNILNRAAGGSGEKFSAPAGFAENESGKNFKTGFQPPPNSRIFKAEPPVEPETKSPPVKIFKSEIEPEIELELGDESETENRAPVEERAPETAASAVAEEPVSPPPVEQQTAAAQSEKSAPRVIKSREVPASQATLGDRKTNPMGRAALTRENPEILIGQTVKGRYRISEKIGETEQSFAYIAEDKLVAGKRVQVRILMDEEASAFFTDNVFAEERVSLSHVVHPNVASVIDSGELPEGKPFVITEYVEGKSIKEMLAATGQFNILRAARIVRQASYALSEMHQNRIFHRGLTAENIILTVSENGIEQVKLTDFGISRTNPRGENLAYQAPERIEGDAATAASDLYSLAVVAYQMLTNRLPFDYSSAKNLLKSQRAPLALRPSDVRRDATPTVDEILEKALAFNRSARYPKARDFGDAFFNHVTTAELWQTGGESEEKVEAQTSAENTKAETISAGVASKNESEMEIPTAFVAAKPTEENGAEKKSTEDLLWERRSPEPPKTAKRNWLVTALLGAVVLGALGSLYYFAFRPNQPEFDRTAQTQTESAATAANDSAPNTTTVQKPTPTPEEIESPPLPRSIATPQDSIYFANAKENLKPEVSKNFLGFSLYYPKDWRANDAKGNFLDVSKNASTGTPVEQMLVSFYDSKGTFKADREMFPKLVKEKTESQLKAFVPNYRTVSEGETTVNNGWRAYEIKFEGAGKTASGENIKLFGRRVYIPAARNGMKNGYVLTMLATSLSPEIKSADDVGVTGDLAKILETFEPNQNF